MGFAGVVLFFQTSICIGLTIGAGAIVARAIGAGEREQARRLAGSSLMLMGLVTGAVGLLTVPFLDPILTALGAQDETKHFAISYLRIVSPTSPLLGIGMCLSALLRAVGDARRAMNVTLYAGLATAVLDPILIFGFGLDLVGAAIAALLSRSVLVYIGWQGAMRVHDMVAWPAVSSMMADARALFRVAGPATLTNIATPAASAYVTYYMAKFGDPAVAGLAIADRIVLVAFRAIFALTGAIGPIFAQNFLGARRFDRISETLRAALIVMLIYVLTVWFLLFLGQDMVVLDFSGAERHGGSDPAVLQRRGGRLPVHRLPLRCQLRLQQLRVPAAFHPFQLGPRDAAGTLPFVTLGAWLWQAEGVLYGQMAGRPRLRAGCPPDRLPRGQDG